MHSHEPGTESATFSVVHYRMRRWNVWWFVGLASLAVNVIVSAFTKGEHLLHLGKFWFPAQNPYKPLLLLNGALVVYFLSSVSSSDRSFEHGYLKIYTIRLRFVAALAIAITVAYVPTLMVNMSHHDWTHRHISANLNSWHAVWRLFVAPQPDGMYRPLTFFSFWLDYKVFGTTLWAYHLQSLGFHLFNALLVALIALRLGFGPWISQTSAVLFGVSASHFEAVLWPAARFDLLAVTFSEVSLLLFLAYATSRGMRSHSYAVLSLISFVVAVLNKETAYSLVLLIPALIATHSSWNLPAVSRRRSIYFVLALVSCAVLLIAVRFKVFGGIGGYGYATAKPATLSLKSIYSLVVNSLSLPIFAINSTVQSFASALIVAVYSFIVLLFPLWNRGANIVEKRLLISFTLFSAAPVISVIGWIQPSLQHGRHLYWPSVWMSLFLALVIHRMVHRTIILCSFVALQIAGLNYNIWVYRDMLERINRSVTLIQQTVGTSLLPVAEVQIIGVPDDPNGVFYFNSEMKERVERGLPNIPVRLCPLGEACSTLPEGNVYTFQWNTKWRILDAIGVTSTHIGSP
jgi:hypothetical protein